MKLKDASSLEEKLYKPTQHVKKQRHYFADKGLSTQSYGLSSSHVWMWDLDHEETWTPKNWCLNCSVEEDSWVPCTARRSNQSILKEISPQSWTFIGGTDAEAEAPMLWPPDAKNWLIGKDPDAGKDWRQEEKGMTEDEVVGWHHRFNWHEFEQAPAVGDGQRSLVCCSPWGHKELDTTEPLNLLTVTWI